MLLSLVLLFTFGSTAILTVALWWYQTYSRLFSFLKKIPGPPGYPIVGNLFHSFASQEELFKIDRKFAKQYHPLYFEWTMNYAAVNLYAPEDIESVLCSNKHIDKGIVYNFLHAWLRTGLLTSGGTKWQTRRRILTPAFHFSILQEFVPIFNEETRKILKELKEGVVDVVPPVTKFTLLSIADTSMGVKLDASRESCLNYQKAIYTFGHALTYRMMRPWLFSDTIFYRFTRFGHSVKKAVNTLHSFSRNVIVERKQTGVRKTGKKQAMLDLLLSAKSQGADIDDEGIAEEVDTFMFEGHDTTAVAICYALLALANHSNIQEEVFQEIKDVLGDPTKPPNFSELKEMAFLERCLKETLRLFPSVPSISRVLKEDMITSSGYVIPKNATVNIHIYDLHHNPEIYPNPEKFDPDRFLPENTKTRHPFAYLPFSAGPRNCIGQKYAMLELKAVLCGILGSFVLEAVNKIEDVAMITDLVLRSKEGIKVRFRPRS